MYSCYMMMMLKFEIVDLTDLIAGRHGPLHFVPLRRRTSRSLFHLTTKMMEWLLGRSEQGANVAPPLLIDLIYVRHSHESRRLFPPCASKCFSLPAVVAGIRWEAARACVRLAGEGQMGTSHSYDRKEGHATLFAPICRRRLSSTTTSG